MDFFAKQELSPDTYVIRFQMPEDMRTIGYETCQYLLVEASIKNKQTGELEKH